VADLLGVDEDTATARLEGLVFADPADGGRLVPRAEYLSGNVVGKLDDATAAAAKNPVWRKNVKALAAVVPEPLGAEDVEPRMGAAWIDAETHQLFLSEILGSRVQVEHPAAPCGGRGRPYGVKAPKNGARRPSPQAGSLRPSWNSARSGSPTTESSMR
jgi:N12 class adenine-specific DNA methylase